jgi:hypothetical protein
MNLDPTSTLNGAQPFSAITMKTIHLDAGVQLGTDPPKAAYLHQASALVGADYESATAPQIEYASRVMRAAWSGL